MTPLANAVMDRRDSEQTMDFVTALSMRGSEGALAVSLFQDQYASMKAKTYRRRSHTSSTYDRKNVALDRLGHWCGIILEDGQWGWKRDKNMPSFPWVLYVEIPTGQASFHTKERRTGPRYRKEWDGERTSRERICRWCDQVMNLPPSNMLVMPFGKHACLPVKGIDKGYRNWLLGSEKMQRFHDTFRAVWSPVQDQNNQPSLERLNQ